MVALDPIGALFRESWRLYKERFWLFLKIAAVPGALLALGNIGLARGTIAAAFMGGLLVFVGWIASFIASLALISAVARGTSFEESYGAALKLFWPAAWLCILEGIIIFGGYALLVVPGIILSVSLAFATYALVLEGKRGMGALAMSREYVRGHWWPIVGRGALLILVYLGVMLIIYVPFIVIFGKIAGVVVNAILLLCLTPFALAYNYKIYENLKRLKSDAGAKAEKAPRTFFIVCMVACGLAVVAAIIGAGVVIALLAKAFKNGTITLPQPYGPVAHPYGSSTPIYLNNPFK
jgi:hypothetical protein